MNERDTLKKTVTILKESMEKQKDEYEKRLRRFRQDHERIKMAMERQIDSRGTDSHNDSFTNEDDATAQSGSLATTKNVKKDDSTFRWYQKKIMDMEKKCEARVRAAKRGKVDRPPWIQRK